MKFLWTQKGTRQRVPLQNTVQFKKVFKRSVKLACVPSTPLITGFLPILTLKPFQQT